MPHGAALLHTTQELLDRTDSTLPELVAAFEDLLGMQPTDSIETGGNLSQGPDLNDNLVRAVCGAINRIAMTPNPSESDARLTSLLLRCVINQHAR